MASDDTIDLRDGQEPEDSGGRWGRTGLSGRLRRSRGGGTDVADRAMDQMDAEPMASEPVSRSAAETWFSLAKPVEYDEWGDPIIEGVPRGPNTVGLRRMYFASDDDESPT